jgi:S-adenosylmethionine decarboxylase
LISCYRSESSFFVWPHKLILKTCGRTLNLLGVPRILAIAAEHAGLKNVYQLFYSRKSFMFPEHQLAPHRDWTAEVQFLDNIFEGAGGGNAYTIGKVNGDHWLLYITGPGASDRDEVVSTLPALDYTVEIMMSDLAQPARAPFFCSGDGGGVPPLTDAERGMKMSEATRITTLFPTHLTTLDAYAFTPCGYSSNALIKWGMDSDSKPAKHPPGGHIPSEHGEHEVGSEGEGYYTIHVTPEEGYSYASFECNIALPADTPHSVNPAGEFTRIPDLRTLVRRVAAIFQPGRLTLSIFMSTSNYQDSRGDTEIEAAQKAFRAALQGIEKPDAPGESVRYRRTDKINYEFGSYDLAFATFERRNAER